MSISQGQTNSFKKELFSGFHAFDSSYRAVDMFKIALYTIAASLDATAVVYTPVNEIMGFGYAAGGLTLTPVAPLTSGSTACLSFANAVWSPAAFSAAGAMIYNASQGNRTVAILAFGNTKTATTSFVVQFPVDDASNAIIRYA